MSITVGGAIDPLLGYLSSAIGDEAQLLGGVHRDAQFIQDELESMNAFLHQLAEASTDHDYLVRQWRKQVRDLAIDTQCCIDLYAHRVGRARAPRARGVWGHVHRAIFFLQTIPARHQVATQVRELKTRARDISERRQRYSVQVLPKATNEIDGRSGCGGGNALLLHNAYRRGLVDIEPLKDETLLLIHWLCKQALLHPEETEAGPGWPIVVIAVVAHDKADVGDLVKEVYNHSSLPGLFDCKAFVTIQRPLFLPQVLDDMIQKLRIPHEAASDYQQQQQQLEELKRQVKGRRFFVVVENPDYPSPWNEMKNILGSSGCSPGSVIMVITKDSELAQRFSPDRTMKHSFVQVFLEKANRLVPVEWDDEKRGIIHHVLEKCDLDLFCMRLFLGALYIHPYISKKQLVDLCTSLDSSSTAWPDADTATSTCIRMRMMWFCYEMLPKMTRTCLLYLSIFPPNSCVRRTSLVRRWVAEGPVIQGDGRELARDTAERCFDDLVALGFMAISKAGNLDSVISCKVHRFVHDFITKLVKQESFGDERLPSSLARHLSVSTYVQWHQVSHRKQQQGDITTFIESLPTFYRVASLKLMDLDYCKYLKNKHMKIICNNLFLLKYLSIRSTKISHLPREINKLQQLEMLDIRQTRVPSSATKGLLIPMLKHLLAGPISNRVGTSPEEEFSTVRMPCKIGEMIEMETLSHVQVAEDDDEKLEHVKNLKRLRNLGVVIHGKQDNINRLLRAVTELSECLCKLSVWVRPPRKGRNNVVLHMGIEIIDSLPKSLEILSINGITGGLPDWIEDLPHLTEITLRQTFLADGSMQMLGKLEGLRCLTLRHRSYIEDSLTFKTNEFKNINCLVIQGASDIKRIIFEFGTAPKLAKIVWTFTSMDITADTIVGLGNLPNLKKVEFNGDCDPIHMQWAVALHPNRPDFRYKLPTF
uniref:Uncharacterized protein n=1 Tax=Avena sativa TaxID=4498 RepID=A0ACD5W5A9_AVESA